MEIAPTINKKCSIFQHFLSKKKLYNTSKKQRKPQQQHMVNNENEEGTSNPPGNYAVVENSTSSRKSWTNVIAFHQQENGVEVETSHPVSILAARYAKIETNPSLPMIDMALIAFS